MSASHPRSGPRSRSTAPTRLTKAAGARAGRAKPRGATAPATAAIVAASAAGDPRARIVQAARTHFFRLGFARFTMDDLAAELGMSKKTLYLHFRSKDELLDALIDLKSGRIRAGFEAILAAPAGSFSERTMEILRHTITEVGEISSIFLHDLRRFAPASYERLEQVRARIVPMVWERLLREGIAAGDVRPDIDVPFTAQVMLLGLQTLLLPDNLERLRLQPHEIVVRFVQILFAGLLTNAGRAEHEKTRLASGLLFPAR